MCVLSYIPQCKQFCALLKVKGQTASDVLLKVKIARVITGRSLLLSSAKYIQRQCNPHKCSPNKHESHTVLVQEKKGLKKHYKYAVFQNAKVLPLFDVEFAPNKKTTKK